MYLAVVLISILVILLLIVPSILPSLMSVVLVHLQVLHRGRAGNGRHHRAIRQVFEEGTARSIFFTCSARPDSTP